LVGWGDETMVQIIDQIDKFILKKRVEKTKHDNWVQEKFLGGRPLDPSMSPNEICKNMKIQCFEYENTMLKYAKILKQMKIQYFYKIKI